MSRYFVLIEDTLGETVDQPGVLARILDDGSDIEVMYDKDQWRSAPSLIQYFAGEPGAVMITRPRAQELIRDFPWPGSRFPQTDSS